MITKTTTLAELFNIAVSAIDEVTTGEIFIVRDLFRVFEWARISRGVRTQLGSMIFAYANGATGAFVIEPLDKTAQNQQKYKKL